MMRVKKKVREIIFNLSGINTVILILSVIFFSVVQQVRFNDDQRIKVFEFEDDEESNQTRRLYWEFFAVDRARFKDRVGLIKSSIGHIFHKNHRDKVYFDRIATQAEKKAYQQQESKTVIDGDAAAE